MQVVIPPLSISLPQWVAILECAWRCRIEADSLKLQENRMDCIDLREFVALEVKAEPEMFRRPKSMDVPLAEEKVGLNSLDQALLLASRGEAYDLPPETVDAVRDNDAPRDIGDFLEVRAARNPETLDQAKERLGE